MTKNRIIIGITGLLCALLSAPVASAQATNLEYGIDRQGADYSNFDLATPDYNICKNACEADGRCQAWTYVHPGWQNPTLARCWLKTAAPTGQSSGCCYSGVKQPTREIGWDRPGSDYRNFDLAWDATAATCEYYCQVDSRCWAYTFVNANAQGPLPRCWLKDSVPPLVPSASCTSGAWH